MTTVRDFKNLVLRESGVSDSEEFCGISDAHRAFYARLNALGSSRGMPADPSKPIPPNIDEAAVLTEQEERRLLADFHALRRNHDASAPTLRSTTLLSRSS